MSEQDRPKPSRDVLADWDPTNDDRELALSERQAIRGLLMTSVRTPQAASRARAWRGLVLAAGVAVVVTVAVWAPSIVRLFRPSESPRRDVELSTDRAPAEATASRVQIQMRTKGGTQIVWFVEREQADAQ